VATLESGFDRADDRGWISLTGDIPNSSNFSSDFVESPLDSLLIMGASYQHYIYSWLGLPSWLKYSYAKVLTLQAKNKRGLVEADGVHSSLDRYPYHEVAAVEWKMTLRQKAKDRLELKNRYHYSLPEKGGWLASAMDWSQGSLTWTVGVDILGSEVNPNSAEAGLFTRYRNNDRVFGGVSYVF
jgi:hypothetical protein